MIYLITGVPGSGKTLYAVSTLLKQLSAQRPKKNGVEIERRICVDNIKDLVVPHEQLCGLVLNDRDDLVKEDEAGNGVWNWPDWCKPGDIIVIDEVQRHWRPRGMGAKPPREIQALETHRHMGVDFIIITQNPMLIDQNVRRLVGRHQHVRRLFGMQRAVIYDWDGCSVDVTRTKSAVVSFFNYPKSAYKLYKSSELHTKQKQKIPLWLAVPVLAVVGGVLVAPTAYATLHGAMSGKGVGQTHEQPGSAKSSGIDITSGLPGRTLAFPVAPASQPASSVIPVQTPSTVQSSVVAALTPSPESVEYAGCIVVRDRCGCYTPQGKRVTVSLDVCLPNAGMSDQPKAVVKSEPEAVSRVSIASDADAFAHMRRVALLH